MRSLTPLVAPYRLGPVALTRDLRAAGNPHWRLYASDKVRVTYGVVSAPGVDPLALDTRIAAARLLLRDGMFISRRTAAFLLNLPVGTADTTIEIGAVRPVKPPVR